MAVCVRNKSNSHDVENLGENYSVQINYPSAIPQLSIVRRLYILLIAFFATFQLFAQVPRGAEKAYERALDAYNSKELQTALVELYKAINKFEEYADAHEAWINVILKNVTEKDSDVLIRLLDSISEIQRS